MNCYSISKGLPSLFLLRLFLFVGKCFCESEIPLFLFSNSSFFPRMFVLEMMILMANKFRVSSYLPPHGSVNNGVQSLNHRILDATLRLVLSSRILIWMLGGSPMT